jgi:diguanylate cyclase (GGDEF)-like protein
MSHNDEDLMQFSEDATLAPSTPASPEPWRVLIVDDEEQVHQVTRFALQGAVVLGRQLQFDSAYSAAEARERLGQGRYACILLDVVMETEDAGLKLVGEIRERFEDPAVRIVLRTGQPGYAPEVEVIQKYDINDYRCKSELTSHRLLTTMTAALRSFQQIRAIEASREGLEVILDAASSLMAVKAVKAFSDGVLMQVCGMLQCETDGIVCARLRQPDGKDRLQVLSGCGRYADAADLPLESLGNSTVVSRVQTTMSVRRSDFGSDHAALYIQSPRDEQLVIHVSTEAPLSELDRKLLQIFSINVAVGFDNAHLFEELEVLAFHDHLTGLWNRSALERELQRRIQQGGPLVVVVADIDNFQAVNDGLGHDIGDRTLQASAAILAEVFGRRTFIARSSADSFAMILQNLDSEELDASLRLLATRLARNIEVEGNDIPLTMSLGVARYPEHGETANEIFQNAGIALKQAKRVSRSSYQYFDPRFEQALQHRLQTIRELRYAIERNSLRLHYQPQVDLKTRTVFGVEALIRWLRDDLELQAPQRFIPAAEDSGQIVAMGEWILFEACRQQQRWERASGRSLGMAVNVSMRQLKDPEFASMVKRIVHEVSIDPGKLELEVTESMMMDDADGMTRVLQELREAGIRIAIDDFGTGYSSLSHLQRLPIDRLKIDRAFITGLTERAEDEVIAAMIINMGHLLNLRVVAEGVETEAQLERLIQMGCDDAQGFLFGKPVAADELLELAAKIG